ncbi:MAG: FAD-dependent oxidoreductase [Candidatus Omnitrophota bacterium]
MGITRTDILIVGGGIIGASIAYYLARNNVDTLLVDKLEPAAGASGACDGYICMQSKRTGRHLKLAKTSAQLYQNLANELGEDIEYEKKGSLVIIENIKQLEESKKMIIVHRANKLDVRLLTTYQACTLEPELSPQIYGATYAPDDAQVNPLRVVYAYLKKARERGALLLLRSEVVAIKMRKTKAEEALTKQDRIKFNKIINAAGIDSRALAGMIGFDLPIQPRRGQVLVTEIAERIIDRLIACNCYLNLKFDDQLKGIGTTIEQTKDGNLLIGATREDAHCNIVTMPGISAIASHAIKIIPGLKDIKIIRAFSGIRPYNPQGLPLLGYADTADNFINACGHNGDGITLAPITGKLICDLIINNRQEIDESLLEEEQGVIV